MPTASRPAQPRSLKENPPLKILISGASGFIGGELVRQLEEDGHTVLRLVRSEPKSESERTWAPSARMVDAGLIESVDAVINLSGAPTGHLPWTRGYKKQILDSRIDSTAALAEAMGRASSPPAVFLNASAVGYYGDRPAERLTEESSKGEGFLADVVDKWEATAHIAPEATRVVTFRTGLVVGRGGAFTPLIPLTRLGLGSRFGTGGQHWPWISLYDEAAAIRHLLTSSLSGPVNLAGPTPATSDRITRLLAKDMHRWYGFAIPEPIITTALGAAGMDLLLASQKVLPQRLLEDGFVFRHSTVETAIDEMIATA
ncbi:TIGR01777 family oxidoreductase [Glaciihabitans sp. dw_435]|uniref:TIGR01777 family oxidoreductase n=1 Tax=Glaciihabitans sp. dw_435 TaxID=2720081 RepID=UPI001BD5BA4B|nr:TIGR01777 family oxidoreductase [Glaciihabitans sp. dw_435]